MKVHSQKQARWLWMNRGKKGLGTAKAKDALRGKRIKALPVRSRKGKG